MQIKNKIVVITGASAGLGKAMALEFAKTGAIPILLARSEEKLSSIVQEIKKAGGKAAFYPVDLSNASQTETISNQILREHGAPDVLVNNVGAGVWRFVEETSPEEAVQMMSLPYFAAFNATHFFLPGMLKRASGSIVIVNSPASVIPWPGATGYVAARWALRGFSLALDLDLHQTGIRVLQAYPPLISDSEYFDRNPGSLERLPKIAKLVPTKNTAEVARRIVKGVENDQRELVMGIVLKFFYLLNQLSPGLVRFLANSSGWKR